MEQKKHLDYGAVSLHVCQLLLYTMAANILLGATVFLLGGAIRAWLLPVSFVIGAMLLLVFYEESIRAQALGEIAGTLLLIVVLIALCGLLYDISYDGNYYHKVAVGLMNRGWNPWQSLPQDYAMEAFGVNPDGTLWVEAYCKGTWIIATSIYAITGNIEHGKVYTALGMVCAFLITFAFLYREKKSPLFCLLFSAAAFFNPIAAAQVDSYYVDGYLHVLLYVLLVALTMEVCSDRYSRKLSASLIAATMLICGNIKFTGLLYGGIFCIVYFLWYVIRQYVQQPDKKLWFLACCRRGIPYAGLAAVTMFWAGSNSYLTNFLRHKSLTYPLTGEGALDIMIVNSPFPEENRLFNMLQSLFAKLDNPVVPNGRLPRFKLPFTVDFSCEIASLRVEDCRYAGFGIFFSGILLVALVVLIVMLVRMKKDERFLFFGMNLLLFMALTFGVQENWWARYVPCLYFLVLFSLYLLLNHPHRGLRLGGTALALLMICNAGLFAAPWLLQLPESMEIRRNLEQAAVWEQVEVDLGAFTGIWFNFTDCGVQCIYNAALNDNPEAIPLNYQNVSYLPVE